MEINAFLDDQNYAKCKDFTGEVLAEVDITTSIGKVTGEKIINQDGDVMNMFLGIPYAQPPTGNLRFVPPEPITSLDNLQERIKYILRYI